MYMLKNLFTATLEEAQELEKLAKKQNKIIDIHLYYDFFFIEQ